MRGHNEKAATVHQIAAHAGLQLTDFNSLTGGSINEVFLLNTPSGKWVLKVNRSSGFPGMFEAEKAGLEALRDTHHFDIPEVLDIGNLRSHSYLLMEFIPEGKKNTEFWSYFARSLASLHKRTSPEFGFPTQNYIGSLTQYNEYESTAADFYINQRLMPQFKMALENGFTFKNLDVILSNIAESIPGEPPALIHGDLWSGNYIVNQEGQPCLIDPAVSFAPREMDLAMMKLFGGFPKEVFETYSDIFPLAPGFKNRIPLWQLYYLLVHLNIFGSSYLPSIKEILRVYS